MPSSTTSSDLSSPAHRRELGHLLGVLALAGVGVAATYLAPPLADLRPWIPGEDLPLVHLLGSALRVEEDTWGDVALTAHPLPAAAVLTTPVAAAADTPSTLPTRPPAVATPLVVPPGALDAVFQGLAEVEAGGTSRIVRVCHWGDSTIAADGITSRVRARLQERYGDGGPGFLAVGADPRWQQRQDVLRTTEGEWVSANLTNADAASPRYGLAGVASTATAAASALLGGQKAESGRQPLTRFDVYYQTQPGGGTLSAATKGGGFTVSTASERTGDAFRAIDVPAGATTLRVRAGGDGPVTVFGVALETAGPGITWESFGVQGANVGSYRYNQNASHLRRQVERRAPDLVVLMTGGNELAWPDVEKGEGRIYTDLYREVVQRLRAGAPQASCLLVSPLDQATRERGTVVSKRGLDTLLRVQTTVAREEGCAYWNARAAMGGAGGFQIFLSAKLAWTDLAHLSEAGLDLLGDSFADAFLGAWETWRAQAG